MKLEESIHILSSLGYNVVQNVDKFIDESVNTLLNSMEKRGATRTKAYQTLVEMAINKPRNVTAENPWNDADQKFHNLQNTIQSSMSKSANPKPQTIQKWKEKLDSFKADVSNPAVIAELPNLESYLNGETDIYTSGNSDPEKGRLTDDFDGNVKKIKASISSVGSKGTGYEATLKRLTELENSKDEFTAEENRIIAKLRIALASAKVKGEQKAAENGKIINFVPAEGQRVNRITYRLRTANIEHTVNDDNTITITSKIPKAKELLDGLGEFVVPTFTAPEEQSPVESSAQYSVNNEDLDFFKDLIHDSGCGGFIVDNESEGTTTITVSGNEDNLNKLAELIETEEVAAELVINTDEPVEDVAEEIADEVTDIDEVDSEEIDEPVDDEDYVDEDDEYIDPTIAAAAAITPEDEYIEANEDEEI